MPFGGYKQVGAGARQVLRNRAGRTRRPSRSGSTWVERRVSENRAGGRPASSRRSATPPTSTARLSIWENFSLGFTYLSPVVGVYTLFAMSFSTGGPPDRVVLRADRPGPAAGVPGVRPEIVSQFPISGGLYPWARPPGRQALGPGWPGGSTSGLCGSRLAGGWRPAGAPFFATLDSAVDNQPGPSPPRLRWRMIAAAAADEPERHPAAVAGGDVRLRLPS